ncbi:MAG TPA: cation:proton antiporter, partial [Mycobacteriales bacterium]|nr:cation:proton antiporter [Mycobacteriales bacterium]
MPDLPRATVGPAPTRDGPFRGPVGSGRPPPAPRHPPCGSIESREVGLSHTGLDAHTATVLWTQLAALLLLARLLGAAARRLGQPPIVGSLCAGLVAGPSVFGQLLPAAFHWFLPGGAQGSALGAIAGFSLLILLIGLGAETDLPLIRSLGRPAAWVITASIVVPLGAGLAVGALLPARLMGPTPHRASFMLLIAGAISVSSLPVVARIITEMGMIRRDVGQLTVATATVNDAYGFALLAILLALATNGGATHLWVALLALVLLVPVVAVVGQRLVDRALRQVRRGGPDQAGAIAVCVLATLVLAAVCQALGLDAALGAFVAGIVVGRSRFIQTRALSSIEWASDAVFAPLYFATAGLSVDVTLLRRPTTAIACGVVLVVGLVAKFGAAHLGGWLAQLPRRERTALGLGLNGRGAMQVILGSAGLAAGLLSPAAYTVVILASIISSMLVPPLLRRSLQGWEGTVEEQQRLRHEKQMQTNVVVRGQRLLLPSRGSRNSFAAAQILDLGWPRASEVTLLSIVSPGAPLPDLTPARAAFGDRVVREEQVEDDDPVAAILAEAVLGYGVIAVGAAEQPSEERLLPAFVDELLNRSPIPLLVVRRGSRAGDALRPARILVPVTGNAASRAGQEVATTIGRNTDAEVTLMHVLTRPEERPSRRRWVEPRRRATTAGRPRAATAVLDQARANAAEQELDPDVVLRHGLSAGAEVHEQARLLDADLVVVGSSVRRVGDHPFLG